MFTQGLYYQVLQYGLPVTLAAYCARQRLLKYREREARFGVKVEVDDYIVPVIYSRKPLSGTHFRSTSNLEDMLVERYWPSERHGPGSVELDFGGREDELFLLELDLCMQAPHMSVMSGAAGMGKDIFGRLRL